MKQDVVLVFLFNYNTFKVVSVKTDTVKMYVHFSFCGFRCFVHEKGSVSRKHPVLPIKKVLSLVSRNVIMLHLIIQFPLSYLSSDHLQEVKKVKANFNLLPLNVLEVV